MIALSVAIEAEGWAEAGDLELSAHRAVEAALASLSERPAGDQTIDLLLTDDAAIRELNRAWRGQDKATNVLSFPSPPLPVRSGVPRHLGDIALAYETVRREAADEGKGLAAHVSHLVVHGVLHLLGHDHGTDRDAVSMERIETEALARLGIPDPHGFQEPHGAAIAREPAEAS